MSATAAVLLLLALGADPEPEPLHWGFAAMPLLNFSSDTGLGLGVRGQAQRVGGLSAPYQVSLEAQAYGSTGGTQLHFLSIDVPSIAGSGWRLDGMAGYSRNVAAYYYGLGDHSPADDAQPNAADPGANASAAVSQAPAPSNRYVESAPIVRVRSRRHLIGPLSLQLGYRFLYEGVRAPEGSRLALEAPFGVHGGVFSEVGAGLAIDTRDDELAPTRGVLIETSVRSTLRLLGSTGDSVGVFGSAAGYQPIARGFLLAARIAVDAQFGDVPFNRQGDFGTLLSPFLVVAGVGGGLTVRGLLQSEYVGKLKLVSNVELRFPFLDFQLFGKSLALSGVAFVDAGQVDAGALRLGAGGGLRIRWGRFFLVRLDAAYAEGRTRIYADFGNVF